MMRWQCTFRISNCGFPCEVLHRSFVQLNCISLGSGKKVLLVCCSGIFSALCKYIHNDVVKHHSNGDKTKVILITCHPVWLGKYNKLISVQFDLKIIRNYCQIYGICAYSSRFYLSKHLQVSWIFVQLKKQFVLKIESLIFFDEFWFSDEHIQDYLLNNGWTFGKCSP